MYAVIQTGGKQYRVKPGDLLVVDRLEGEPGSVVAFDRVLMIGEGDAVTIGAPIVAGARVSATLVETRKAKKIKVFKKIRRQGYRRTRGHRQFQSVLRVTALAAGDRSEAWDGEVDLTPLAVLNARARNLARGMEAASLRTPPPAKDKPTKTKAVRAKVEKKSAKPSTPAKAAKKASGSATKPKTSAAPGEASAASKQVKPAKGLAKAKPAAAKEPAGKATPKKARVKTGKPPAKA